MLGILCAFDALYSFHLSFMAQFNSLLFVFSGSFLELHEEKKSVSGTVGVNLVPRHCNNQNSWCLHYPDAMRKIQNVRSNTGVCTRLLRSFRLLLAWELVQAL